MSQKGISIRYDLYLRLLETPFKFNLKHNYIQGKLSTTKAVVSINEEEQLIG